MVLMILAGLGIGILSSLTGLGGGFLAVPLLLYLGRTTQMSVGTSFVLVFIVALSSLAAHYRLGNIDIKTGLMLGLGGVVGAQIGPLILQHTSDQKYVARSRLRHFPSIWRVSFFNQVRSVVVSLIVSLHIFCPLSMNLVSDIVTSGLVSFIISDYNRTSMNIIFR